MKTNIHEQEAVIMKEWLQLAQSNLDADELCVDGLLFGEISLIRMAVGIVNLGMKSRPGQRPRVDC